MKTGNTKALNDFSKKSYRVVLDRAGTVITLMKKNGKFKTVDAKLKSVEDAYGTCNTLYQQSKGGSNSEKDAAQAAKQVLEAAMKELLSGVNTEANGSRELLNSSGFKLSKDTRTKQVLGSIVNFGGDPGQNAGELVVSFDAQSAVRASAFAFTEGNGIVNTNWSFKFTSQCSAIITGLTPGTTVTLQATAIGPHDQIVVSQMISVAVGYGKTSNGRRRGKKG